VARDKKVVGVFVRKFHCIPGCCAEISLKLKVPVIINTINESPIATS
jgi:hypothetical protein